MFATLLKHVAVGSLNRKINSAVTGGTRRLAIIADKVSPWSSTRRRKAVLDNQQPATFTIKNGPIFSGHIFGSCRDVSGEAVLTTSIVGYPESLTDPSYGGQSLAFTSPLIGNCGVPSGEARDELDLPEAFFRCVSPLLVKFTSC